MQIRGSQIDACSRARFEAFVRRMSDMLAAKFPDWCASETLDAAARDKLVREAVQQAGLYSVEREADLELYIQCLPLLSRTFDRDANFPWAGEILNRPDLDGARKMDLIHDHLVFSLSK